MSKNRIHNVFLVDPLNGAAPIYDVENNQPFIVLTEHGVELRHNYSSHFEIPLSRQINNPEFDFYHTSTPDDIKKSLEELLIFLYNYKLKTNDFVLTSNFCKAFNSKSSIGHICGTDHPNLNDASKRDIEIAFDNNLDFDLKYKFHKLEQMNENDFMFLTDSEHFGVLPVDFNQNKFGAAILNHKYSSVKVFRCKQ